MKSNLLQKHLDGSRSGFIRNRTEINSARCIDFGMSRLGLSRPVLVISGFWRSGTTWLQEIMAESICAKTVFEPLSPFNQYSQHDLSDLSDRDRGLVHATFPAGWARDNEIWRYLNSSFSGERSTWFSMHCRHSLKESFSKKIVVKDVRIQFNIRQISEAFDIPVIHLRRDPVSVIESLLSVNWGWNFDQLKICDILPSGVQSPRYTDAIKSIGDFEDDVESRVAAIWALTELAASESIENLLSGRIVRYEDLQRAGQSGINDLCEWAGLKKLKSPNIQKPSTTSRIKESLLDGEVQFSKKDEIASRRRSKVLAVVKKIFPEAIQRCDM